MDGHAGSASVRMKDGTSLRVETDFQTVDSAGGMVYDPKWSGYDKNGHFHVAVQGKYDIQYPTLIEHWLVGRCCTCNDWHEAGEVSTGFTCRFCGVDVVPGTKVVPPKTLRFATTRRYIREGWIQFPKEGLQGMIDSGVASKVTYDSSGYAKAYVHQDLTKAEFDVLLEEYWQDVERAKEQ